MFLEYTSFEIEQERPFSTFSGSLIENISEATKLATSLILVFQDASSIVKPGNPPLESSLVKHFQHLFLRSLHFQIVA
jgi:hypothetical protein